MLRDKADFSDLIVMSGKDKEITIINTNDMEYLEIGYLFEIFKHPGESVGNGFQCTVFK